MSLDQRARPSALPDLVSVKPNLRARVLRKIASRFLPDIQDGHLSVALPSGDIIECGRAGSQPAVQITIHNWRALRKIGLHGDTGFASAIEDGDLSIDDVLPLFDLALRNRTNFEHSMTPSKLGLLLSRVRHGLRRNSRKGSRRNISEHYDLGNAFYRAWLDDSMTYSSALYGAKTTSLEEAQTAKIDRIVELLRLPRDARVLEIGCGWGALMEELLKQDCSVTGITLSREQAAYATKRLEQDVSRGKAQVLIKDYRDCAAGYDRIVSVEMIEAVGEAYWPAYFETLRRNLVKGGIAVIQAITIAEQRYEAYRSEPDFIQQRIFPGGMLPTMEHIRKHAEAAGLKLTHQELFGQSYAQTLAEWRKRFHTAWPKIQTFGFDMRFKRLWDYYLAYCEAGFQHQATNVGLYVLQRD